MSPRDLHPLTSSSSDASDSARAEFETLVRAHYTGLCSFVYRLVRSRSTAEDIVQTLLANLWAQRETFQYDHPQAYLYRAARNRAINYLRRERVRAAWEAQATIAAQDESSPSPSDDAADLRAAIDAAVAALPERCRLVFTMNREQGLKYSEIADVLGISIKTVETQMGRALKTLRLRLADFLPSGAILLAVHELRARLFG